MATARVRVQQAQAAVLALSDDPTVPSLAAFERQLWTLLLALGRALVALYLVRQTGHPRRTTYAWAGAVWTETGTYAAAVATRFGKVLWVRPVAQRLDGCAYDRPVDRAVGLCGGASLGVIVQVAYLCARLAFVPAREVFATTHEWRPSQDMTLRIVDAVGALARPFLEQAAVPPDDGEVLVIEVDSRGAPMIGPEEMARRRQPRRRARGAKRERRRAHRRAHPRPRRAPGQKSKNAKGAVVGVIYTLRRTADGWEGPVNKRVYATFAGHEALFTWLAREARRRGYGRKPTLFLADGARAIWDRQQRFFPRAAVCLDWFHVVEKLWAAGTCLHREGSVALRTWVEAQKARLRRGHGAAVVRELRAAWRAIPKTGPGTKAKRTRLKRIWQFLHRHRARLNYARFLAQGWDIGTGAAEGAVRNLVELRLDGPGMRWGRERSEHVLHLRCVLLSGLWDDFATFLDGHPKLTLAAHPMPATPYRAKSKKAA